MTFQIKIMTTNPGCNTYEQGRIKPTLKNIFVQLPYVEIKARVIYRKEVYRV